MKRKDSNSRLPVSPSVLTTRRSFQARSEMGKGSRDERRVEFISNPTSARQNGNERQDSNNFLLSVKQPSPIRTMLRQKSPDSERCPVRSVNPPGYTYTLGTLTPPTGAAADPGAWALLHSMRCLDTDGAPSAIDEKRFADDYYIRTLKSRGPAGLTGGKETAAEMLLAAEEAGGASALLAETLNGIEDAKAGMGGKGKKSKKKGGKGKKSKKKAGSRSRSKSSSRSRSRSKSSSKSSSRGRSSSSGATKKKKASQASGAKRSASSSKSRSSSKKSSKSTSPSREKKAGGRNTTSPRLRSSSKTSTASKSRSARTSSTTSRPSSGKSKRGSPPKARAKKSSVVRADKPAPAPSTTSTTSKGAGKKAGKGGQNKDVTQICLKKINTAQYARMKPKQKHKAMINDFVNAYEMGLKMFEEEYAAELARVEKVFREQSHDPQTKEILRLVYGIKYIRMDCYKKLSLAEAIVNALASGVENLLSMLKTNGVTLLEKDSTLVFEAPFIGNNPDKAEGVPMPEIQGEDAKLTEVHPPSLELSEKGANAIRTIQRFFDGTFDFIKDDMVSLTQQVIIPPYRPRLNSQGSSENSVSDGKLRRSPTFKKSNSPTSPSISTMNERPGGKGISAKSKMSRSGGSMQQSPIKRVPSPTSSSARISPDAAVDRAVSEFPSCNDFAAEFNAELEAYSVFKTAEAEKVKQHVELLTNAMTSLLDRIETQHGKFRKKLEAQQRALDEGATHRKAADDVLENRSNREEDAKQATIMARELGKELRTRMDEAEREMRETIQTVLKESAIVSHEAMAYRDYSALEDKKAETENFMLNRMTRSMLDQAEIMRDLQYSIMQMWNKSHPQGREEKNTLVHRTLPDEYNKILRQCGRDTLLRLVYHLSSQSDESMRQLMGALDEHEHFLDSHTQEGDAVKEDEATLAAVTKLMEKIYTEGRIHCNPNKMSNSLADTILFMVEQYNAFMSFSESYARALVRRDDRHKSKTAVPFFSDDAPLPAVLKAINEVHHSPPNAVPCPYSPSLYPKPAHKPIAPCTTTPPSAAAKTVDQQPTVPTPPEEEKRWPGRSLPRLRPSAAEVASALYRANPSVSDPLLTGVSVVGNGRWDGKVPLQSTDPKCGSNPSFITKPRVPYKRTRESSAITKAMEKEAADKRVVVPGPPMRTGLNEYILDTYSNQLDDLLNGNASLANPAKTMKKYVNPDVHFLERRMEIHKEFETS